MPHVSAKVLPDKTLIFLERRLFHALADNNTKGMRRVFGELFTKTERVMFAKRLEIILLIEHGVSTHHISKTLRVSPSTVARFEQALEQGRYTRTRMWLGTQRFTLDILQLLLQLAAVPIKASPIYQKMRRIRT